MMNFKQFSRKKSLRTGEEVQIRAIFPTDKSSLQEAFRRLSENSVRFRFFGLKKELSRDDLIYFTEIDYEKHMALVATIKREKIEQIIAVGRYIELQDTGTVKSAEFALAVLDEYQNRGIGSLLFECLKDIAIMKGISRFEAYVLSDNSRMCEIFKHHAFDYMFKRENDECHVTCSLERPNPTLEWID